VAKLAPAMGYGAPKCSPLYLASTIVSPPAADAIDSTSAFVVPQVRV